MRLLLTADLRFRPVWFRWLEAQAIRYEAIVISGDLLDVFSTVPLNRQVQRATAWLRSLSAKSSVIVCSGNHDTIDIPVERTPCPMPAWLVGLNTTLTVDGNTTVVRDQVIVTSLSFVATIAQKQPILTVGQQLRDERRLPWIVLHHHPPALHQGIGQEELIAGHLVKEFSPSFWVSGRIYGQDPFLKNRGWIQRLGDSIVLNTPQLATGQNLFDAPFPNHIVLDLAQRQLTWNCSFQEEADQETFELG
jgi:Calcineurin-like phosphoesterase